MAPSARVNQLAQRWDEVDGYQIFSRVSEKAGWDRPPIVLVHGLAMSSLYMAPTACRLAARYRIYAPDLPGYGKSQQPRSRLQRALTIEQLSEVLLHWMDRLNIGPAVLIGNSMGCQIIADLAGRRPQRVLRAVMVGPTMDPAARSYPGQMARGALHLVLEPLGFWFVALRDYLNHGFRRTFQSLGYGLRDPIKHKLAAVQAPTLVVRGSRDKIVSEGWAEEVVWRLPRGAYAPIRGAGHVVNYDAPDKLAWVVTRFLESGDEWMG